MPTVHHKGACDFQSHYKSHKEMVVPLEGLRRTTITVMHTAAVIQQKITLHIFKYTFVI